MSNKHYIFLIIFFSAVVCGCKNADPWGERDESTYPTFPEVPSENDDERFLYTTHYGLLNNKQVRNFTLCFDKTKYAACWVAYPLHKCYRGGADRSYASSEVWPTDPDIDAEQAVGKGGYNGYTRGHQIPSADRTANPALNAQTFYMSNMTPQAYDFNGGVWLDLENKVRENMCNDTIYVVTGAHWENTTKKAGKYPIPTHYYKVLLRTRSGNSKKTVFDAPREDLKCIGFWLSHATAVQGNLESYCKSVAEIESLTGFTFFPEVDVDKTECNPSDWGF